MSRNDDRFLCVGALFVYATCAVALLGIATGCGGGGGGGHTASGGNGSGQDVDPEIDTVLSSGTVSPKAGGLVAVKSSDDELDGASVSLPGHRCEFIAPALGPSIADLRERVPEGPNSLIPPLAALRRLPRMRRTRPEGAVR